MMKFCGNGIEILSITTRTIAEKKKRHGKIILLRIF